MTEFPPWTVIKVPFPFIDRQVQRYRPALVMAQTQQTAGPGLLWVLMITSAQNRQWQGDVPISNLSLAGLRIPCRIRPSKIAAVQVIDAERLGLLDIADRPLVLNYISNLVDPFYKLPAKV